MKASGRTLVAPSSGRTGAIPLQCAPPSVFVVLEAHERSIQRSPVPESRATAHVRHHLASGRGQNHVDGEAAAVRRRGAARRQGHGAQDLAAPRPTGWNWRRSAASRSAPCCNSSTTATCLNLLDTPGHKDFSEDTYRVLTAVDAAVMVIDAANGIEPQTRKLFEVCRQRGVPIFTFINKMDRPVKEPLALLDETRARARHERRAVLLADRDGQVLPRRLRPGGGPRARVPARRGSAAGMRTRSSADSAIPPCASASVTEFERARHDIELVRVATPGFSRDAFLAGQQTPVFFGSAINNFGVREVLDALVDIAPPPQPRIALQGPVQPDGERFSGVVFKIQANMDPAHRDRVVFVRVCSGRFERGMKLRIQRTGKEFRPNNVVSFLSQRRELLDEAYAGDIIGIPTHGGIQLGDTLTDGESLQFTGLPFFAPEFFSAIEVVNPLKTKQLRTGLIQLGEEGAIQVFRPLRNTTILLGAVGSLQFEVAVHRLQHEYGVEARLMASPYTAARWVSADDPRRARQVRRG